ncbi:MAG TPA: AI-2E family transporter [Rubrobacteraceae bacterium]|nr:AI-2E family transporter [Rubrobacteraceae bacterium]
MSTSREAARRGNPGSRPTRIPISRRVRNVLLLLGLVVFVLLMWTAPTVPVTLLGGFAAALALSFPVRWLSRLMPRGLAILATFLILIGIVVFAMLFLVPVLIAQLVSLIEATPAIAREARTSFRGWLDPLTELGILPGTREEFMSRFGQDLVELAETVARQALGGLVNVVSVTFGIALTLFAVLFVAIYLLVNVRALKATYLRVAPHHYRTDARELWDSFAFSLSRYLSGLVFVMAVQGAISAVALFVVGVPYALLLGAWVSLTAVIPVLGAWLGAIPAVVLALTVSPTVAVITALVFLGIQQLEGNVLTPRIQGEAVNLPSVLIFLGVIAGGQIAGLLGVLFAVPTLAVARVLFDFFRARLYTE